MCNYMYMVFLSPSETKLRVTCLLKGVYKGTAMRIPKRKLFRVQVRFSAREPPSGFQAGGVNIAA